MCSCTSCDKAFSYFSLLYKCFESAIGIFRSPQAAAMAQPGEPSPTYHNAQSRGATLPIITLILTSISFIVVTLRGYLRIYILRSFGLDDLFIGLALITGITSVVQVILVNSRYGFNRHVWDVPPSDLSHGLMFSIPTSLTLSITLGFIRLSLCCFYRRLVAPTGRKYYHRVILVVMFFVVMLGFTFLIGALLQCRPLRAAWDLTPTYHYSCMSELTFTLCYSIFGVIADFTCLILPMPIIWQLSLPRKDRISILILLGLGIIACGAGLVRTVLQQEASRIQQNRQLDITWATWPFYLTVEIEINAGIVQKIFSLYRSY